MSAIDFPNNLCTNTSQLDAVAKLGHLGVLPPDIIRTILSILPVKNLDAVSRLNKNWNRLTNTYCHHVVSMVWPLWFKVYDSSLTWVGKYIYKARITDNFQKGFFKACFLTLPTTVFAKVAAVKGETVAIYRRTGTLCVTAPQRFREQLDIIRSSDGLILRSIQITGAFYINAQKLYVSNNKKIEVWDWHLGTRLESFSPVINGKIGLMWFKDDRLFFVTTKSKVDFRIFLDEQVINDIYFVNYLINKPLDRYINGLYSLDTRNGLIQKYELMPTQQAGEWRLISRSFDITETTFSAAFYDKTNDVWAIKQWPIVAEVPPEDEIPATLEQIAQFNGIMRQYGGLTFTINPVTHYAELHKDGMVFADEPGWQFVNTAFHINEEGYLIISMAYTADHENNPPRKLTAWNIETGKKVAEIPIHFSPQSLTCLHDLKVMACETLDQQTTKIYVIDLKNGSILAQRTIPMYIGGTYKNDYLEKSFDGEKLVFLHQEPNLIGIRQHICVLDFSTQETNPKKLEDTFPIHTGKETKIGEITDISQNMYENNIPSTPSTPAIIDLFKHGVNLVQVPIWKAIKWTVYGGIGIAAVVYAIALLTFQALAFVFRPLVNRVVALFRN